MPGTPRWAVWAAYAAIVCVLPSALWRTAVGFGADLGTTRAWRQFQQIPGAGTYYVIALSVLSISAACLTLGLVQPWGQRVPGWVPLLGGRLVPTWLAVTLASSGALAVMAICLQSALRWDHIVGFKGRPAPGWYELVTAAYLPALAWGPLVLAVTWAYWRRRSGSRPETT